jgi:predicted 2-oxoglutarate/Fe(II)-dependent dioxygenase YbiX/peroxiredoxin
MDMPEAETAAKPDAPSRDSRDSAPLGMPGFGQIMPAFQVDSDQNPRFQSLSLGGQWMVMMFFGSLNLPLGLAAHDRIVERRALFDDMHAMFFGVGLDPADRSERGLTSSLPGLRYLWDFDGAVSRRYGVADDAGFTPTAFLIDRALRVVAIEPLERIDVLLDQLQAHLAAEQAAPIELGAPVLTVPRILEPAYCQALIDHYEKVGGETSGFMREIDGVTFPMQSDGMKRRRDADIDDEDLRAHLCRAVSYRLIPLIRQAFCWQATRIERYIVACYSAADRGFFKTHRDNTTGGTAHRSFAVTINLNDDFDGGELRFPEFGNRTYRPPVGGATVFSCGLLHEATPVTRGLRYATLPFLYDEAGRAIRDANQSRVATGVLIRSEDKPGDASEGDNS